MITRLAWTACAALAASTVVAVAVGSNAASRPNQLLPRSVVADRAMLADDGRATGQWSDGLGPDRSELLDEFLEALRVMQESYFEPWLGQWPKAIDWTAAVIGTHVAGALSSLSQGLSADDDTREKENLITTYFSQLLSYYFGQDAFSIRNEAYDDMLWVVLGWLEAVEFIDYHTTLFHRSSNQTQPPKPGASPSEPLASGLRNQSWYGKLWIPAFSHRARIFYDIASQGWDTELCGGGMNWNPRLEPYKNAITNELFIAASASMFLYFPGDANTSPFINANDPLAAGPAANSTDMRSPHQVTHLQAALAGYGWLTRSGMRNEQGLYTDGFHISGWKNTSNPNTRCDERNDMVYTYNQGVLLTGQIGLWKVTGDDQFLRDGHKLIQSVIAATGWDLGRDWPFDNIDKLKPGQLPPWHGLGRAGILEEQCDVGGQCSQNSQTFKGIFFHHLTAFCAPLDIAYPAADEAAEPSLDDGRRKLYELDHKEACAAYVGWIRHNAHAALATKDAEGKFGMWWTAGLLQINVSSLAAAPLPDTSPGSDGVDYRTYGVPQDSTWVGSPSHARPPPMREQTDEGDEQEPLMSRRTKHAPAGVRGRPESTDMLQAAAAGDASDPNNRGRGRTVETQGGGLAVLRCLWEISQQATTK